MSYFPLIARRFRANLGEASRAGGIGRGRDVEELKHLQL